MVGATKHARATGTIGTHAVRGGISSRPTPMTESSNDIPLAAAGRRAATAVSLLRGLPTIGERYLPIANSFTAVRLILAIMVLYAHCWAVIGSEERDQLFRATDGVFTMGTLAVRCFFVLSGFLVIQSMDTTAAPRRIGKYLLKRALRIWPALVVSTVFVAFVLGLLVTKRPVADYYSFQGGWSPWWWTFDNLTFNAFSGLLGWHIRIRDVFASNPAGAVPNASLWSLRFEVAMYLLLAILAVMCRYRPRVMAGLAAGGGLAAIVALQAGIVPPYPHLWVVSEWSIFVHLGTYFFLGSAVYAYRDAIPASNTVAVMAGVAALLTSTMSIGFIVAPLAISYALLVVSISPRLAWYERRVGDYSYGTYIYAWPVQQTVMHFLAPTSPYVMLALALPITLGMAIVSWHLIERPALRLKRSFSWTRRPMPTAESAAPSARGG